MKPSESISNNKTQSDSGVSQSPQIKRINFQYLVNEMGNVLALRKGIFYTIKELFIRPGKNVRTFLLEDRTRLVKPIVYTIFCSLIYTIVSQQLHFEDKYYEGAYKEFGSEDSAIAAVEWIRQNYGYVNIIMGLFIAPCLKLFFRKSNYNFFELMVLWLYLTGNTMVITLFFGIAETLTDTSLFLISSLFSTVYICWAIGQFFGEGKLLNYFKALLAYLSGFILIAVGSFITGIVIAATNSLA